MRSSPLLVTIFALASEALADDGMWHPQQYAGSGSTNANANANANAVNAQAAGTPAGAGVAQTPSVQAYAVATAKTTPAAGPAAPAAQGSWEQAVTWPAGCEKWANPCPPGAKISGGAVAGAVATQTPDAAAANSKTVVTTTTSAPYENGFTSYTSMTDAFGVITGMPTVVTVPAGLSSTTTAAARTTLQTTTRASNSTSLATRTPTRTQTGFSTGTTTPSFSAAGRVYTGAGLPLVVAAVAVLAAFA